MIRGKIVWKNGNNVDTRPALPPATRGLPTFVSYFDMMPSGFTQESYTQRMIPGSMFSVPMGTYIISGIWDHTDSDQLTYISHAKYNPNRTTSATYKKVTNSLIAIYVGQQRLTEWDGKGWARIMRPMFVVNGQIVASLNASSVVPT